MRLAERLDRFQQRHKWAGFPLAVIYKFVDDQGNYLAALIAYYGFLSLFPLLLLLVSILGVVLRGNPELQAQILDSTLRQFPVIGEELGDPQRLGGSTVAVVIGIVASLVAGNLANQEEDGACIGCGMLFVLSLPIAGFAASLLYVWLKRR